MSAIREFILNAKVASVTKRVVFECGCISEFPLVGQFTDLGWHVVPCAPCARARVNGKIAEGELEARAQEAWERSAASNAR